MRITISKVTSEELNKVSRLIEDADNLGRQMGSELLTLKAIAINAEYKEKHLARKPILLDIEIGVNESMANNSQHVMQMTNRLFGCLERFTVKLGPRCSMD